MTKLINIHDGFFFTEKIEDLELELSFRNADMIVGLALLCGVALGWNDGRCDGAVGLLVGFILGDDGS